MSNLVQNDRWSVPAKDFAAKVSTHDLKGFFGSIPKGRSIIVEPGTRAYLVDDGVVFGEVGSGSYTLETIIEQLRFWDKRQSTLILVRSEEVILDANLLDYPSQEGICVNLDIQWSLKIRDLAHFLDNMMGGHLKVSIEDLESKLSPIFNQAVYSAIGTYPINEILKPRFNQILIENVRGALDYKFQRFGLQFIDIAALKVSHKHSDTFAQATTDQYLANRQNDFLNSGYRIGDKNLEARLDGVKRRIPLRDELRKAIQEDKFLRIQNEQEFEAFMTEVDKTKLLRKEDWEELRKAYEERKEDRSRIREHLTATIDLQHARELDELRNEIRHAFRLKSLQQEIELSQLSNAKDKQSWTQELEAEKAKSAFERDQKLDRIRGKWDRIREIQTNQRDDSWKEVLHQKQLEEVQTEIAIARAERAKRIEIIEHEVRIRFENEKLEQQRRAQEMEIDLRKTRSDHQLDRLRQIQEMNAKAAEQQQRMQVELENIQADGSHARDMARIGAMSNLSTEALIATSQQTNAELLVDLKKQEISQNASRHSIEAQAAERLNEERLKLYQQMNEAERQKADAIAEAFKFAMQAQTGAVNQMISGMTQVAKPQPVIAHNVPPAAPRVDSWHVVIHGEQTGPMTLAQVRKHIHEGRVTLATMVWKTGLSAWIQADQANDLLAIFAELDASTPPPFQGGPPPLN